MGKQKGDAWVKRREKIIKKGEEGDRRKVKGYKEGRKGIKNKNSGPKGPVRPGQYGSFLEVGPSVDSVGRLAILE